MWKWADSQHAFLLQRCRQDPFVIWPKMASLEPVLESKVFRKCGTLSSCNIPPLILSLPLSLPQSPKNTTETTMLPTHLAINQRIYQKVASVSPVYVPLSLFISLGPWGPIPLLSTAPDTRTERERMRWDAKGFHKCHFFTNDLLSFLVKHCFTAPILA